MKKLVTLIAIVVLTDAASAASFTFTLSIVGAPATITSGPGGATFTMNVIGDANFGTHVLSSNYALASNSSLVTNIQYNPPAWSMFTTDAGYLGNGNYGQANLGQLLIFGQPPFDIPGPGSALPNADLGSFEVTVGPNTFGVLTFNLLPGGPFTLETIDMINGSTQRGRGSNNNILILNGASINVVPAPSVMALLGLGGLVAGRRRR